MYHPPNENTLLQSNFNEYCYSRPGLVPIWAASAKSKGTNSERQREGDSRTPAGLHLNAQMVTHVNVQTSTCSNAQIIKVLQAPLSSVRTFKLLNFEHLDVRKSGYVSVLSAAY